MLNYSTLYKSYSLTYQYQQEGVTGAVPLYLVLSSLMVASIVGSNRRKDDDDNHDGNETEKHWIANTSSTLRLI